MTLKKRLMKNLCTVGGGMGSAILLTLVAAEPTWKTWMWWGVAFFGLQALLGALAIWEWKTRGDC